MKRILFVLMGICSLLATSLSAATPVVRFNGKVVDEENRPIGYATVRFQKAGVAAVTTPDGHFSVQISAGKYLLEVEMLGYDHYRHPVEVVADNNRLFVVRLQTKVHSVEQLEVVANGVGRLRRSAYNALAVDATELHNSTLTLSDALGTLPGMKLRESGGLGSDMQLMMDGFGGRHVKVFVDGVPQEGVGRSFSLNNIPVNFAERIEVYKGVVPVGFGTDALGGVLSTL